MFYRENENSSINQVLRSLEQTYNANKQQASLEPPVFGIRPEYIQAAMQFSSESIGKISQYVREEAQKNPWTLLGKVALGSFAVGMMLRKRNQRKRGKNE